MKRKIKYFLISLMLMTACSKNSEESVRGNLMDFSTRYVEDVKSVINDKKSFRNGDAFGVFGIYYTQDNLSDKLGIFTNTKISYNGSIWTYENKKHWIPSKKYMFRAFFPYNEQGRTGSYVLTNEFGLTPETSHFSIGNFTVKKEIEQQEDLMYSDIVTRGPILVNQPQDKIAFTFSHLLTNVNVKIKPSTANGYTDFHLLDVKLVGMKSSGAYDSENGWTPQGAVDKIGYRQSYSGKTEPIPETGQIVWPQGILMIPQGVNLSTAPQNTQPIQIEIHFTVKSPEGEVLKDYTIADLPTGNWLKSKKVMYVITIDYHDEIRFFEITVEPWVYSRDSDLIVIK